MKIGMTLLKSDDAIKAKQRAKSHEEKTMIMRNRKRKLDRIKNRIDPQGQQYAADIKSNDAINKNEKRPTDPSRKAVIIRVI